ncbi:hypothetical protein FHR24_001953 [Wenyingzhuangia heitensis]|uniref:GH16 domain-containing protein n=1 Tax=Wenyingzhuangia heitensis TaxID=1487859 RepID=A0ABX0UC60_9FLAO|nr:family 16 glycosylhydrolase [Wenyingzhuangia heitensis]NIJ45485.1 hypothetical protein [Wenyingzhuangia heitensis]
MKKIVSITLSLFSITSLFADPPTPKKGYRWVINQEYSDEFNGTELDRSKWNNTFHGWKGRKPAMFDPSTVSVNNGNMQIKNGMLPQEKNGYTIAGGAVQSKKETASFGYYEVNFKASKINMSTTFWMSNSKQPVDFVTNKSNGENCAKDKYSQELDIVESIGGTFNRTNKFRTQMNFNTHYRYVDCNGGREKFYSAGNNAIEGNGQKSNAKLSSESWQDFHTYGAYWKNANEVSFYADNRFVGDVKVSTEVVDKPFDRSMKINMVTETYNWVQPIPTIEELNNDKINTSYYNWIRSYELVPVDKNYTSNYAPIYKEEIQLTETPKVMSRKKIEISYTYKANKNTKALLKVVDASNKVVSTTSFKVLAGFGNNSQLVKLDHKISKKETYTYQITLVK